MKRNILHFGVHQGKTHTDVHRHQYLGTTHINTDTTTTEGL